jgi:uncharacterized protein involved in exopolysaccharide biosynthesis
MTGESQNMSAPGLAVSAHEPGAPPPVPESPDLFDYALIRNYVGFALRSPGRHKVLAIACFFLIVAVGFAAASVIPYRYQVQAKILAQRNPLMDSLSNPGLSREGSAPTRAAREVLIRRENLIALAKQTDLVNRYMNERAPAVEARDWLMSRLSGDNRDPEKLLENLVDALEDRLVVIASQEGTVTITFEWSNPETGRRIVEAAVQSFLESRYASEITAVSETIAILEDHDARLQKEIVASVARLTEKEKASRLRVGSRQEQRPRVTRIRVAPVEDEELGRLQAMAAARQRAMTELEGFRRRRLEELETQLMQQLAVYAPKHPEVLNTRQAIDSLKNPSPQIEALSTEIDDLNRQIARRTGTRLPTRSHVVPSDPVSEVEPTFPPLVSDSGDTELEFERSHLEVLERQRAHFMDRIDVAEVELETARAAFKYRYSVITPPQLPKKPIKDYRRLIWFGSLFGGVAAALAVSIGADLRSQRVLEPWQVERTSGLRILARAREQKRE